MAQEPLPNSDHDNSDEPMDPLSVLALPYGFDSPAGSPVYRTQRALRMIYNNPREAESRGFFSKLGTALKYETVTAGLIRDWAEKPFIRDPDFKVTDKLIETYASDLDEETQKRIADASHSFPQWLHELDDVRIAIKQRQEYFKGNLFRKAQGAAAVIAAAGGEAVALTIGATLGASAVAAPSGPGAAVAGITAGAATAAARTNRIRSILSLMWESRRTHAMLKAAGLAAAVDIPLELTRHHLDKSLTKTDLLIALGASGGLTVGLAAWKPHLFDKMARINRQMMRESAREEAIESGREAGIPEKALKAIAPKRHRITVVTDDEITAEVASLKGKALREEGKRLGIKGAGRMKADDLRHEITEHRRGLLPGADAAVAQVERELAEIHDLPTLRVRARAVGAKHAKGAQAVTIKKAIVKAVRSQAESGAMEVTKKLNIEKNLLGGRLRVVVGDISHTVKFATAAERALWRLGSGRNFNGKGKLIKTLKEYGIEDPEALGKEIRKAAKSHLRGIESIPGKTLLIDGETLLGRKFLPRTKGRFTMEVDEDLLTEAQKKARRGARKPAKDPEGEDPHPVASADEDVYIVDGTPVSSGPAGGARVIDLSPEDLAEAVEDTGGIPRSAGERGVGGRERSARFFGGETTWHRKVPKWLGGGIARFLHDVLNPAAHRLKMMEGVDPEAGRLLHAATDVLLESPRRGGQNLQSIIRTNHQNLMNELAAGLRAAQSAADDLGRVLSDNDVTRALTKTFKGDLDEPERLAVEALQAFHGRLLAYAQKYGLIDEVIADSASYFHRIWRTTSFTEFAQKKDDLIEFFTQSVLTHSNNTGMKESVAKQAAKRIVEYGLDPKLARSSNNTRVWLDGVRNKLTAKKESLNLTDEDVQDIIDVVVGQVGDEPHLKGFAKRRIELNENYSATLGGREVHIDEFMHRDIMKVTSQYAHRVLGAVEMRKGMHAIFGENIDIKSAIERLRSTVASEDNQEYIENAMRMAMQRLSGQPIWGDGVLSGPRQMKWILMGQAFAHGTLGQVLGVAQLPEIANIMMRAGAANARMAFPSLRTFGNTFLMGIRKEAGVRGRDGRLLDKIAAELETFCGVGGEYFTGEHLLRRLDDMGLDDGIGTGVLSKFLDVGRQISMLNPLGIIPMDTFLRRWATKAHFQNFVNQAYKIKNGKPQLIDTFWRRDLHRFKELGLNDKELQRVFDALADPNVVKVKQGLFGNYKVMDIDFTKVKDQGAYDRLALAIRRGVDQAVQRQSMGEIPLWMSASPIIKLLTQYRVFSIASRAKQLGSGLARADATEAINVVGSIGLGYAGYTLLTYGRALNKSPHERENYLAGRLTWEEGLKSGIMRCSYSSVLPMIIDSVMSPFTEGGEGFFDPSGRTTAQGVGILEGTVPYSTLYKGLGKVGIEGLGDIFTDRTMSKKDARDILRAVWITQVPGISQAANYLISESDLPER